MWILLLALWGQRGATAPGAVAAFAPAFSTREGEGDRIARPGRTAGSGVENPILPSTLTRGGSAPIPPAPGPCPGWTRGTPFVAPDDAVEGDPDEREEGARTAAPCQGLPDPGRQALNTSAASPESRVTARGRPLFLVCHRFVC